MGSMLSSIEKRDEQVIVITNEEEWEQLKAEYTEQEKLFCERCLMVSWPRYRNTIKTKFDSGLFMYMGRLVVKRINNTEEVA